MDLITRACPLCNSHDDSQIYTESNFNFASLDKFAFASRKIPEYMHYRMISCRTCDLLYASPLPPANILAMNYAEADFDSSVEAHCAAKTYAKLLPDIAKRIPDKEGALDIGTGDGAFLEQLLKHEFKGVVGIEPSHAPIESANDVVRPLIIHGTFNPGVFPEKRFSLITCFQTMEHLPNPFEMCESAYAMLKQRGAIYIICHDYRSLSAKLLGMKSPIFDIEHLQLFSPQSATYLLNRCGFSNITVRPIVNSYPLYYWMKLLPIPGKIKLYILDKLSTKPIGSYNLPLPVGNIAIIGYKS